MATVAELQKRIDTLQKQLRKAGDHLKRLATENGTLAEQVDRLAESETQLKTESGQLAAAATEYKDEIARLTSEKDKLKQQADEEKNKARQEIEQMQKQIAECENAQRECSDKEAAVSKEWEDAAKELCMHAGLAPGSKGPAVLIALKSAIGSKGSEDGSDSRVNELSAKVSELQITLDEGIEAKRALEDQAKELEARIGSFESSELALAAVLANVGDIDDIPASVPESLRPSIERIIDDFKTQRLASQAESEAHRSRISALEAKLEESKAERDAAVAAREELNKDYDLLVERIGSMKDALKAKMNAESDEVKRLRKEIAQAKADTKAKEQVASSRGARIKELEGSAQSLRAELGDIKKALWESQEVAQRVQNDYSDSAEESSRLLAEVNAKLQAAEEQMEVEAAERNQLEDRVEQLQNELNQALNSESQWVDEREMHLVTIQNLQGALESLQEAKDSEVDIAVEKLREELRASAKSQRAAVARAEQAETKLRKIELSGATAEQCQQKITDQAAEIEKLRHEVSVLKDHLNESMRRLREEGNDFNLDKRVITNLIVGFLALPYGDSKRFEILQLMSSILQFSEEQQERVGLIRKAGRRAPLSPGPSSAASEPPSDASQDTKDSFSDQWISFLLRESSTTRNSRS